MKKIANSISFSLLYCSYCKVTAQSQRSACAPGATSRTTTRRTTTTTRRTGEESQDYWHSELLPPSPLRSDLFTLPFSPSLSQH